MEGTMMPGHVTLSVDTSIGAAYIQFADTRVAETIEETPDIQVDVDATGTVVGVEVLNLTADLPVESLTRKYHFASYEAELALSQVKPTLQAVMHSGGAGRAFVPALQAG